MDIALLAGAVLTVVRPFLRTFMSGTEDAMEEAGTQATQGAKDLAKRVWERLFPNVREHPTAEKAAEAVATTDDEDAAGALRFAIRQILSEDEGLATELARLIEEGKQRGEVAADVVIYGGQHADRGGINVGRDVHGDIHTRPSTPQEG